MSGDSFSQAMNKKYENFDFDLEISISLSFTSTPLH
jgi:hypothetical protein